MRISGRIFIFVNINFFLNKSKFWNQERSPPLHSRQITKTIFLTYFEPLHLTTDLYESKIHTNTKINFSNQNTLQK